MFFAGLGARFSQLFDVDLSEFEELADDLSLDATQAQWLLLSECLAELDVEAVTPTLDAMLVAVHPRRRLPGFEADVIYETLTPDGFPAEARALFEEAVLVGVNSGYDPHEGFETLEALVFATGKSAPGETGTKTFHLVTREKVQTFKTPLEFLDAFAPHDWIRM
ncbi:MAG: hypothetical protein AAGE52_04350 [Myxococcota bacterium]